MAVRCHLPGYLRAFTGGQSVVWLEGSPTNVGEALALLWALHPGVRDRVMTERGEVRPHVNVFVGSENIRYTGGLSTPIGDGSEISIVPAVSGGSRTKAGRRGSARLTPLPPVRDTEVPLGVPGMGPG
ncbi:MAG: MoaD/ThiS family protein [Candidatus Methylomirabilales bacterium]